jgi:hypothetical protein
LVINATYKLIRGLKFKKKNPTNMIKTIEIWSYSCKYLQT